MGTKTTHSVKAGGTKTTHSVQGGCKKDAFCAGRAARNRHILCRVGASASAKGGIENAYPLSRAHLRPQKGVLKKHTPYLGRICVCVSVFLSVSARLGVPKVRVKGGRHENDAFYAGRAAGKPRIL